MDDSILIDDSTFRRFQVKLPTTAADFRRIVAHLDANNVPDIAVAARVGYAGRDGFEISWWIERSEED